MNRKKRLLLLVLVVAIFSVFIVGIAYAEPSEGPPEEAWSISGKLFDMCMSRFGDEEACGIFAGAVYQQCEAMFGEQVWC